MPLPATLDPAARYARKDGLPQSVLGDDDLVVLNIAGGKYHGLKGPAMRIWGLLQSPVSLGEICETLTGEFEVEPEECRADVEAFLRQLDGENLLTTAS